MTGKHDIEQDSLKSTVHSLSIKQFQSVCVSVRERDRVWEFKPAMYGKLNVY